VSAGSVTVNGGTLTAGDLSTFGGAAPSIALSDPSGGVALTVGSDNASTTYGGSIADAAGGPGSVVKVGTGTQTLTGRLTNTGGYTVSGGTLKFSGAVVQPGFGSLTAGAGATVQYDGGARVFGGFLAGPGTHVIGTGGASFTGTTAFNGTTITQNGPATLTTFTSGGAITSNAALTWNGGLQTSSGSLTVNATATVQNFESDGVTTVNSGGTLAVGSGNLVLGGGSRTFVGSAASPGGTVTLPAGATIELNGAMLANNGTIGSSGAGLVNVNFGSLAKGAGSYAGGYAVYDGGKFSPGNSPGTVTSGPATWGAGGAYQWEINDATGTAGTHWDLSQITGTLTVAAGTTTNSKFTIAVAGLTSLNAPGLPAHFDPSQSYQWTIATATSVVGFSPSAFVVDASGFAAPGAFSVVQAGNAVALRFTPVPEPAAVLGCCALTAAGWVGLWRRRRRAAASLPAAPGPSAEVVSHGAGRHRPARSRRDAADAAGPAVRSRGE
jgi:autotransporter-associated beta strand protein